MREKKYIHCLSVKRTKNFTLSLVYACIRIHVVAKKLAKLNIDAPYKTLKIKEQMWQLVTSIENKKQAITIYLESL